MFVLHDIFQGGLFSGGEPAPPDFAGGGSAPLFPVVPQKILDEPGEPPFTAGEPSGDAELDALMADFVRAFLAAPDALPRQASLRFGDAETYRRFLAAARKRGVDIRGTLDALRAVSIGFTDGAGLRAALEGFADAAERLEPNYAVAIPNIPTPTEVRTSAGEPVGFGAGLLAALGISADNAAFGDGVTLAVLDSGIADHPAFANADLSTIALSGASSASGDDIGHGTAVTSIIAGEISQAPGVAPKSTILSYRITNDSGLSDSFLLAEGIIAATDAGAQLINISLGSESDSSLVADAVSYAARNGTVIVAASGNETKADATYPARYSGVVSVGGNDAGGFQLSFSNSSPTLDLSAPGYQVNAAYPGERIISFTGTSASAPVVTGALAAVMSERQVSAVDALALLRLTADEAGAPGFDSAYGTGILNVGRALASGRTSVADIAAVAPYYDSASNQILFSVENRGTTPMVNIPLQISAGGKTASTYFPNIPPNSESFYAYQLSPGAFAAGQPLSVEARVSSGTQSDAFPGNNTSRAQVLGP